MTAPESSHVRAVVFARRPGVEKNRLALPLDNTQNLVGLGSAFDSGRRLERSGLHRRLVLIERTSFGLPAGDAAVVILNGALHLGAIASGRLQNPEQDRVPAHIGRITVHYDVAIAAYPHLAKRLLYLCVYRGLSLFVLCKQL